MTSLPCLGRLSPLLFRVAFPLLLLLPFALLQLLLLTGLLAGLPGLRLGLAPALGLFLLRS